MGSFNSKSIVDDIVARDGYYPGDPPEYRIVKLVEYTGFSGETNWGGVLACEMPLGIGERYETPTEYINDPHVHWKCSDYELLYGQQKR